MLNIEYVDINSIKPYKNNAKLHPKEQIEQIKKSIEEFGMDDPIAVWNNEIVEGHGRLLACKELGMSEIPIIRLDHLTDEERKAYTLVHNKLTMNSGFDIDILNTELADFDTIDMTEYGFDLASDIGVGDAPDWAESTQEKVENILNLGKANYFGVGKYDIPEILPTYKLPEIKQWIGFNYVLSDKDPEGKAVHFFIDDYQFERIWNNPDAYVEKLKQYVCVLSPDFSPYGDMPMATQIFNHYRKHWVGRYLQEQGVNVIPTIRASTDDRCYEWYLDGEPKEAIVCISSMWATTSDEIYQSFLKEYNTMFETLKPIKVFVYGKKIEGLPGNIEYIESFAESRWKDAKE